MTNKKGCVFWFTGNSGAGKTTIAMEVERRLKEEGIISYRIDGDNIRKGLNSDLGYSEKDRKENIRRVSEVAKLFSDFGIITIVCTISPLREMRDISRKILNENPLKEIYIKASIATCEKRDPKGMYKNIYNSSNYIIYQEEIDNKTIINTEELSIEQSIEKAMFEIKKCLRREE